MRQRSRRGGPPPREGISGGDPQDGFRNNPRGGSYRPKTPSLFPRRRRREEEAEIPEKTAIVPKALLEMLLFVHLIQKTQDRIAILKNNAPILLKKKIIPRLLLQQLFLKEQKKIFLLKNNEKIVLLPLLLLP
jgi:hypothetical protein